MRVLTVGNMYPPRHLGGYELIWQQGVRQLRDAGHDVRVLTTDFGDPSIAEQDGDVHRELRWYWRDHRFPRASARERLALERHNVGILDRHLADQHPDVVSWWAMGGMSLSLIERGDARGYPSCGVVCDDWLLYGPEVDQWTRIFNGRPLLGRIAAGITGIPTGPGLDRPSAWLFLSAALRDRAAAVHDLPLTDVCRLGADLEVFELAPKQPWRWRLLYAGRIDPRKGIDTAILALAMLPDEATLTIVGGGDEEHERALRSLVTDCEVESRVTFLRQRTRQQLAALYADADALVFPVTWEEPWGLVPLEAMAVGTPVVATGKGGSAEYLRDGENCILFDAGDPASLASGLRALAADPMVSDQIRAGGRATVEGLGSSQLGEAVERTLERAMAAGA